MNTLKIARLLAYIKVYFGSNPLPFCTNDMYREFIFHPGEVLFYTSNFIRAISEALVMENLKPDTKFRIKVEMEVSIEHCAGAKKILYDGECVASQLQAGTAAELLALFPGMDEKIVFAIMCALDCTA